AGGRFLGGIGVSGAPSAVDVECAQAGIDSVADDLEFAE
ncbi:MAG: heme-binding protein, partial [bacterium]